MRYLHLYHYGSSDAVSIKIQLRIHIQNLTKGRKQLLYSLYHLELTN